MITPFIELFFLDSNFLAPLTELDFSVASAELVKWFMLGLLLFVLVCCRSLLSFALTLATLGVTTLLLFLPWLNYSLVLATISGILITAGVKSFVELYNLTFKHRNKNVNTDMVYASEELGGSPKTWYWITIVFTAIVSGLTLFWGFYS